MVASELSIDYAPMQLQGQSQESAFVNINYRHHQHSPAIVCT